MKFVGYLLFLVASGIMVYNDLGLLSMIGIAFCYIVGCTFTYLE